MNINEFKQKTARRGFLGAVAQFAAAVGLASVALPGKLYASPVLPAPKENKPLGDAEEWFNKVKGKHRIIFDATRPHEIFPFAWPKVFLASNEKTGTPASDCTAVVVLRHEAIGYAFENRLWEKYKFGNVFKAEDPKTKQPSLRNPFWMPAADDFKIPGTGPVKLGINDLQAEGVMFCVCDMAIGVFSTVIAAGMKMDAAEVRKDWMSGLLPGVQVVPSGVWAVGRAQEHGCTYCFAG